MKEKENNREGFSSGIGVFFATLGSAVGLGNIWRFPYLTGTNGGGAFLVTYLLCICFVGIPVMLCEFYIGRRTRKNVMGAVKQLKPKNPAWKVIGVISILTAYFILFFYTCVAGWVYSYVFKALVGQFNGVSSAKTAEIFAKASTSAVPPILWQIVVVVVVSAILILGVKNGIERITKTLMPVLFILIIICDIRALTLSGGMKGVTFLLKPDFTKLTAAGILTALGLSFFKLSLGMGTMVTYSSYFTKENNMVNTAFRVAVADTIVSILAGLAIFPAVFSFGMKPDAGPSLLFQIIPMVFSHMPLGSVLLVAFFILSSIAATTAIISMMQVLVAYFNEEMRLSRAKAVIINSIVVIVIGAAATLSLGGNHAISSISIFGRNLFDTFDYFSSNYFMPIGGFAIILLAGHFVSKDSFKDELTNHGVLKNEKLVNTLGFLIRYVTPILLILVFLNSLGVIKWMLGKF